MDDFLIIGGGIAGLTAGAHLAAHGTVTLLEAEDVLGYHASSRSAAIFIPTYGAPSVKALSLASARDLHDTGLTSPRGVMAVGRAGEEEKLAHVAADLSLSPIPVADALSFVPILDPAVITCAAHREEAWDIDTDALLQLYAKRVRANGQVVTRAPVTAIRRGDGWEVEAGEVDAQAWLGATATHAISQFGGGALTAGHRITLRNAEATPSREGPLPAPPLPDPNARLPVVPGPQEDRFAPGALDTLTREPFTVTPAYDRMGMRLDGPELALADALALHDTRALVMPLDGDRALPAEILAETLQARGVPALVVADARAALEAFTEAAAPADRLLVTGSHLTVAAVLARTRSAPVG
mgnify:CR=1 FL=1